jgi:hypothetical protein
MFSGSMKDDIGALCAAGPRPVLKVGGRRVTPTPARLMLMAAE